MIIAIFITAIGLLSSFYSIKFLKHRRKVSRWLTAEGKVINKEIALKTLSSGDSRANYRLVVAYEYVVQGKTYNGNKLYAIELLKGEKGFLKSDAEKKLQKIPENVQVHYNPVNHTESFIYADGLMFPLIGLVFGLLFLLIGIIYLLAEIL